MELRDPPAALAHPSVAPLDVLLRSFDPLGAAAAPNVYVHRPPVSTANPTGTEGDGLGRSDDPGRDVGRGAVAVLRVAGAAHLPIVDRAPVPVDRHQGTAVVEPDRLEEVDELVEDEASVAVVAPQLPSVEMGRQWPPPAERGGFSRRRHYGGA